jgi:hypothetical protein
VAEGCSTCDARSQYLGASSPALPRAGAGGREGATMDLSGPETLSAGKATTMPLRSQHQARCVRAGHLEGYPAEDVCQNLPRVRRGHSKCATEHAANGRSGLGQYEVPSAPVELRLHEFTQWQMQRSCCPVILLAVVAAIPVWLPAGGFPSGWPCLQIRQSRPSAAACPSLCNFYWSVSGAQTAGLESQAPPTRSGSLTGQR